MALPPAFAVLTRSRQRHVGQSDTGKDADGALTLEAGMRSELSRISQAGDTDKSKSFFYPKPRLQLTWVPGKGHGSVSVAYQDLYVHYHTNSRGDRQVPGVIDGRAVLLQKAARRCVFNLFDAVRHQHRDALAAQGLAIALFHVISFA